MKNAPKQPKTDKAMTQAQVTQAPEQTPPQVLVANHYLKNISFASTKSPGDFSANVEPKVNTLINVFATEKREDQYEVVIQIHANVSHQDEKIFDLKLEYAGLCIVKGITDENNQKDKVLRITCANLIFPFARKMVAETTREAGYPPMLINLLDFTGVYNQNQTAVNA